LLDVVSGKVFLMLHPDTLDVAIPFIERFEGVELDAYLCPAGVPTICAGLTRYPNGTPVRMGDVCSNGACTGYLKEMLEKEFAPCLREIPDFELFGPSRQAALLSFAWNMGEKFYGSNNFETITRVLKTKAYPEMRDALMLYCRANGTVLAGLERRRKEEANLWESESALPMKAVALHDTWLKVAPVDSACLVEGKGKIGIKQGDVIALADAQQSSAANHVEFVMASAGDRWHAYLPHWELLTAKKS